MRRPVHAVIAVKDLGRAKSRLADVLGPRDRAKLVLAMLCDTLDAAGLVADIASTTVVTPDAQVRATALAHGAQVHSEPLGGNRSADPLNTALSRSATQLHRIHGPVDVLALQADLPALRPSELTGLLAAAPPGRRSIVADHRGIGTTALLVREPGAPLDPRFGPSSARLHRNGGAVELDGCWPGLRLDVDTAADLDLAVGLGIGSATCRVLDEVDSPRWRTTKYSSSIATSGCDRFDR